MVLRRQGTSNLQSELIEMKKLLWAFSVFVVVNASVANETLTVDFVHSTPPEIVLDSKQYTLEGHITLNAMPGARTGLRFTAKLIPEDGAAPSDLTIDKLVAASGSEIWDAEFQVRSSGR